MPFFIPGLRFRRLGEHINLEARVTPISFKGKKILRSVFILVATSQNLINQAKK